MFNCDTRDTTGTHGSGEAFLRRRLDKPALVDYQAVFFSAGGGAGGTGGTPAGGGARAGTGRRRCCRLLKVHGAYCRTHRTALLANDPGEWSENYTDNDVSNTSYATFYIAH